jgi:hypothetical protein
MRGKPSKERVFLILRSAKRVSKDEAEAFHLTTPPPP